MITRVGNKKGKPDAQCYACSFVYFKFSLIYIYIFGVKYCIDLHPQALKCTEMSQYYVTNMIM